MLLGDNHYVLTIIAYIRRVGAKGVLLCNQADLPFKTIRNLCDKHNGGRIGCRPVFF